MWFNPATDRIIRVIDGDTVLVERDGQEVRVRLHGVDAPESDTSFGAGATAALSDWAGEGDSIFNLPTGEQTYNRMVSDLYNEEGKDAAEWMIGQGQGFYQPEFMDYPELAGLQQMAISDQRGMWGSDAGIPMPPSMQRDGAPEAITRETFQDPEVEAYFMSMLPEGGWQPTPPPPSPSVPSPQITPTPREPTVAPKVGQYLGDILQGTVSGFGQVAASLPEVAALGVSILTPGEEDTRVEKGLEYAADVIRRETTDVFEGTLGKQREIDPFGKFSDDKIAALLDLPIGVAQQVPQLLTMLGTGGTAAALKLGPKAIMALQGMAGMMMEAGSHRGAQREAGFGDQDLGTVVYGGLAGGLEALGARGVSHFATGIGDDLLVDPLARAGTRSLQGLMGGAAAEGVTEGLQAGTEQGIQTLLEQTQGWQDFDLKGVATEALLGGLTGGGVSAIRQARTDTMTPEELEAAMEAKAQHERDLLQAKQTMYAKEEAKQILPQVDQLPMEIKPNLTVMSEPELANHYEDLKVDWGLVQNQIQRNMEPIIDPSLVVQQIEDVHQEMQRREQLALPPAPTPQGVQREGFSSIPQSAMPAPETPLTPPPPVVPAGPLPPMPAVEKPPESAPQLNTPDQLHFPPSGVEGQRRMYPEPIPVTPADPEGNRIEITPTVPRPARPPEPSFEREEGHVTKRQEGRPTLPLLKAPVPGIEMQAPYEGDPKPTTLHSGGAKGSDSLFASLAEEAGIPVRAYSFEGHRIANTHGREILTKEQLDHARPIMMKVAEDMGRDLSRASEAVRNLITRNYYQVANADAVYAVAKEFKGEFAQGGTGYAVELARQLGKPVHVFDQSRGAWFRPTGKDGQWVKMLGTPKLQKNFAGIGTRDIQPNGVAAVKKLLKQQARLSPGQQFDVAQGPVPGEVQEKLKVGQEIDREKARKAEVTFEEVKKASKPKRGRPMDAAENLPSTQPEVQAPKEKDTTSVHARYNLPTLQQVKKLFISEKSFDTWPEVKVTQEIVELDETEQTHQTQEEAEDWEAEVFAEGFERLNQIDQVEEASGTDVYNEELELTESEKAPLGDIETTVVGLLSQAAEAVRTAGSQEDLKLLLDHEAQLKEYLASKPNIQKKFPWLTYTDSDFNKIRDGKPILKKGERVPIKVPQDTDPKGRLNVKARLKKARADAAIAAKEFAMATGAPDSRIDVKNMLRWARRKVKMAASEGTYTERHAGIARRLKEQGVIKPRKGQNLKYAYREYVKSVNEQYIRADALIRELNLQERKLRAARRAKVRKQVQKSVHNSLSINTKDGVYKDPDGTEHSFQRLFKDILEDLKEIGADSSDKTIQYDAMYYAVQELAANIPKIQKTVEMWTVLKIIKESKNKDEGVILDVPLEDTAFHQAMAEFKFVKKNRGKKNVDQLRLFTPAMAGHAIEAFGSISKFVAKTTLLVPKGRASEMDENHPIFVEAAKKSGNQSANHRKQRQKAFYRAYRAIKTAEKHMAEKLLEDSEVNDLMEYIDFALLQEERFDAPSNYLPGETGNGPNQVAIFGGEVQESDAHISHDDKVKMFSSAITRLHNTELAGGRTAMSDLLESMDPKNREIWNRMLKKIEDPSDLSLDKWIGQDGFARLPDLSWFQKAIKQVVGEAVYMRHLAAMVAPKHLRASGEKKWLASLMSLARFSPAVKSEWNRWFAARGVFHTVSPHVADMLGEISEQVQKYSNDSIGMGTRIRLEFTKLAEKTGVSVQDMNQDLRGILDGSIKEIPEIYKGKLRSQIKQYKRMLVDLSEDIVSEYRDLAQEAKKAGDEKRATLYLEEASKVDSMKQVYLHGLYKIHLPQTDRAVSARKGWADLNLHKGNPLYENAREVWFRDERISSVLDYIAAHHPDYRSGWDIDKIEKGYLRRTLDMSPHQFEEAVFWNYPAAGWAKYHELKESKDPRERAEAERVRQLLLKANEGLEGQPRRYDIDILANVAVDWAFNEWIKKHDFAKNTRLGDTTKMAEHERKIEDLRALTSKSVWVTKKHQALINSFIKENDLEFEVELPTHTITVNAANPIQSHQLNMIAKKKGKAEFLNTLERLTTVEDKPLKERDEWERETRLPEEIRKALGEIDHPIANHMDTTIVATTRLFQLKAFGDIRRIGMREGWISEVPSGDFTQMTQLNEKHPLYNLWIDPILSKTILGKDNLSRQHRSLQLFYKFNGYTKMNSTVYRPMTQARNFIANLEFFLSHGFLNPMDWRGTGAPILGAIKIYGRAMREAGMKGDEHYLEGILADEQADEDAGLALMREGHRLGLIGAGGIHDLKDALNNGMSTLAIRIKELEKAGLDASGQLKHRESGVPEFEFLQGVQKALRRVAKPAEILYQAGDDLFRLQLYALSKNRLTKLGLDADKAQQIAIWDAQHMFPDYSKLPRFAQVIRRNPLFAPFIAWTVTSTMSFHNTLIKTAAELGSPGARQWLADRAHPELTKKEWGMMRSVGMQRFAGTTLALGGIHAAAALANSSMKEAFGWGDDEEEDFLEIGGSKNEAVAAWQALAGPWSKNSTIVPWPWRDEKEGDVFIQGADLSFMSIFDYVMRPIIAVKKSPHRNKDLGSQLWEAISEVANPFVGAELGVTGIIEAFSFHKFNGIASPGSMFERGIPEQASVWDESAWVLGRLVDNGYLPGIATAIMSVGESFGPHYFSENKRGKTPGRETVAQFFGVRGESLSMSQELHFAVTGLASAAHEIQRAERRARSKSQARKQLSGSSVDAAEKQYREAVLNFQHEIWAIKKLSGWSSSEIYLRIMRDEKGVAIPKKQLMMMVLGGDRFLDYVSLYSPKQRWLIENQHHLNRSTR